MPFEDINGYQVPEQGTEDTENPNYAVAIDTILQDVVQNKLAGSGIELFIPHTGSLNFTANGVAIEDGDYKLERENGTNDYTLSVRRSGVFDVCCRYVDVAGKMTKTETAKTIFIDTSVAESDDANTWSINTNGQNRIAGQLVNMDANNLSPAESLAGQAIVINDAGSVGTADSTTLMQGLALVVTGASIAEKIAVNVKPEWTIALKVNGTPPLDLTGGYVYDGLSVIDRTSEFNNPGANVEIFSNDNDTILIGSGNVFSIIEVFLDTVASQNIQDQFRYSTGNDTWSTLSINSDGTNSFRKSAGQISFTPPVDWATSNLYMGYPTTAAYYIEIRRARNGLTTAPIESQFKVFEVSGKDFLIRGDGTIKPVHMVNTDAPNDSIYFSIDNDKLVYKDINGNVGNLE